METNAIEIRGMRKSFPTFTLGPVDLTVPKGAIYGLIGSNGAGKTTTIDLIMGMGRPDGGTITVFGLDHRKEEVAVKRQVGYMGPDLQYTDWWTIGRAIKFVRAFYDDWDHAYCTNLMQRFNIGMSDRIATLSFGARTKLALVIALSHRPALLLLDEPLAGLDAISKQEVFTELLRAVQDESHTVLISSHDLHDLERFTDHVGIIHNGQLLVEGPTAQLVERFRVVDATAVNGQNIVDIRKACPQGLRILSNEGANWRFLADTTTGAADRLRFLGFTDIVTTPVSLEDLFIALVKGK